jgi:plastocyanin
LLLKGTAIALLLVAFGPAVEPSIATQGNVELTISNYRFCKTTTCSPADQGYVRWTSGPIAGTDNPAAIIDIPEGSTVTWVYRDGVCDSFDCPGHNVRFEDGTPEGLKMGSADARQGPTSVTVKVSQPAGTLIRYFCGSEDHYSIGQTGILRVVGGAS